MIIVYVCSLFCFHIGCYCGEENQMAQTWNVLTNVACTCTRSLIYVIHAHRYTCALGAIQKHFISRASTRSRSFIRTHQPPTPSRVCIHKHTLTHAHSRKRIKKPTRRRLMKEHIHCPRPWLMMAHAHCQMRTGFPLTDTFLVGSMLGVHFFWGLL